METHNHKLVRLILSGRYSKTRIAEACGISRNKVIRWSKQISKLRQDWQAYEQLSEHEIDNLINPAKYMRHTVFDEPDWEYVEKELVSGQVTMKGLYEEYTSSLHEGAKQMSLSQFYEVLKMRRKNNNVAVMHFVYIAGETAQFDFVGKKPELLYGVDEKPISYEVAVGVSCASRMIFAKALPSQTSDHTIATISDMWEFFGGVHSTLIVDNFKAAITKSRTKNSAPIINIRFQAFADYYGFVVAPSRAYHARDKGMVEGAVRIIEHSILAKLRHSRFYTVTELNKAISKLLIELNNRPMKGHGGLSRSKLFEQNDRDALLPLPRARYVDGQWYLNRTVRTNLTFEVEGNHYSVPARYIEKKVNVKITATSVFVYHENKQIAVHERSLGRSIVIIADHHRPPNHSYMIGGQLKQCVETVSHIGPNCMTFIEALHAAHHRSPKSRDLAWEIVQLADDLGVEIVERSAKIAYRVQSNSVSKLRAIAYALSKHPENIVEQTMDINPEPSGNVRGAEYFNKKLKGGA